jgi:hypothetical protein
MRKILVAAFQIISISIHAQQIEQDTLKVKNIEQVTKTETIDSSKMIQISDSTLEINNSDSTIIK